MQFYRSIFLFSALLICITAAGQKKNEAYQLSIKKAQQKIRIDGVRDEADWENAKVASNFFMVLPMEIGRAHV